MSTAASAVTTVDSATTQTTEATLAPVPELSTLTPEEKSAWRATGNMPTKADSATAKKTEKETTQPDSSTGKEKIADTASDSATDKTQKPNLKTKEDTERRFREITDENKTLKQRLEALERGKTSDTRDTKQTSQPAAEAKPTPLKQFLDEFFAKAENKGKAYEDGVEAWQVVRDAERGKELERQVRAQIAQEAAQKDLNTRVEDAKKRYPDYEATVKPAVESIMSNDKIPFPVKAVLNESPVFVDLLYTLSQPEALKDLIATAISSPAAAIRKIVVTEQLVMAELAKGKDGGKATDAAATAAGEGQGGDGKVRDATTGKFVSSTSSSESTAASEPISRAPKPPSEVGGRGTAPTDEVAAALKATPGKLTSSTKDVLNRQYAERHKL